MSVAVHLADCVEWLRAYDGPLFDSAVTDPPYELGFMGKKWDSTGVAFRPETWRAVYDALKPGAHLVAFSGTRTYHRMACAIEDAGFEIRDQLAWCYGSGFPKSHNIGDGWGTSLKPSLEPICLARKPLSEKTVAANVLRWGTGAINVDATRIDTTENLNGGRYSEHGAGEADGNTYGSGINNRKPSQYSQPAGRWPANLLHDGSDEVLAGFPETGAASVGDRGERPGLRGNATKSSDSKGHDDNGGSAARFFYSAKAGPLDRLGSKHPTVKPVDLMRWLVRLVTPKGGRILEPFAGSGTTGIAAMAEGFDCTMLELMPDHVADIERKLAFLRGEGAATFIEHNRHRPAKEAGDMPLFAS